jgi:hypothetical protein
VQSGVSNAMGSYTSVENGRVVPPGGLSSGAYRFPSAATMSWSMSSAGSTVDKVCSSSTTWSRLSPSVNGGGKPSGEVDGGVPTMDVVLALVALLVSLVALGVVLWRCAGRRYAHHL